MTDSILLIITITLGLPWCIIIASLINPARDYFEDSKIVHIEPEGVHLHLGLFVLSFWSPVYCYDNGKMNYSFHPFFIDFFIGGHYTREIKIGFRVLYLEIWFLYEYEK